jgi:hypothetical protein
MRGALCVSLSLTRIFFSEDLENFDMVLRAVNDGLHLFQHTCGLGDALVLQLVVTFICSVEECRTDAEVLPRAITALLTLAASLAMHALTPPLRPDPRWEQRIVGPLSILTDYLQANPWFVGENSTWVGGWVGMNRGGMRREWCI